MLGAVTALLILLTLMPVSWATSKADNVCGILLRMEQVSLGGIEKNTGSISTAERRAHLDELTDALRVAAIYGRISGTDLAQLEANAGKITPKRGSAGANSDMAILLHRLIDKNNCMKSTHSPASAEAANAGLHISSGDSGQSAKRASTSRSAPIATGSFPVVFTAIALCLSSLTLLAWFLDRLRRSRALHPCATKALLVYGDNCTVTAITKIGRYGAHLQAPSVKIPAHGLDLYVAGQKIAATRKSDMKYFMKLDFGQPISTAALESIVRPSSCQDQLAGIGENATPCFFPGCHHDCASHRATALSKRHTGAPAVS